MNTLTKGQLVMTEHGLAWYESLYDSREHCAIPIGLHNNPHLYLRASPATQEHVQAYAMANKWHSEGTGFYSNVHNRFYLRLDANIWTVQLSMGLLSEHFDTAPAQLQEAILCARLLNATKP